MYSDSPLICHLKSSGIIKVKVLKPDNWTIYASDDQVITEKTA